MLHGLIKYLHWTYKKHSLAIGLAAVIIIVTAK